MPPLHQDVIQPDSQLYDQWDNLVNLDLRHMTSRTYSDMRRNGDEWERGWRRKTYTLATFCDSVPEQ
ncbi:10578_t:CDS:2 [Paraglomus occultum]|uniref:10578_t:CDS:1 n=1 Tax=Paraglomus occultum TaxID=144539 RepID=A0A9N9DME2_9GLOM|nr:10578_t:CDS:2 [Paraglomus occultum]